ncbi:MAG TPA: type 4 pilus major pilin [Alphaproteobacteria bacterium]|nr:type 4 pilus major pilin [Alphaproteobacteria bacterium]
MNSSLFRLPCRKFRRATAGGFTLTEIAIVLAVAGLVFGGVWIAWTKVRFANQIKLGSQQLATIVHNTRGIYAEQGGIKGQLTTLTQPLDQLRVFPLDMRQTYATSAGIIFHPWNSSLVNGLGTVQAAADNCSGVSSSDNTTTYGCFDVMYYNLPQAVCNALAIETSSSNMDAQRILINGTLAGDLSAGTMPIKASTSNADCTAAADTNTILWVFMVRN